MWVGSSRRGTLKLDKVNLIFVEDGWILERMAKEIKLHIPEVTMNEHPSDINYFINYMGYDKTLPGKSVALYTHIEESGKPRRRFLDSAPLVDYCVAMCENTASILYNNGAENVRVIHGGVPCRKLLRFGVSGRTYGSGRKGEFLVKNMVDAGYNITSIGKGWPCPTSELDSLEFFQSLDYYVVTSLNEGGPFGMLEALAHGVPVIAPDTGWCWEYSTLRYDRGNWDSLHSLLKGLQPRLWSEWAVDHKQLFEEISNGL